MINTIITCEYSRIEFDSCSLFDDVTELFFAYLRMIFPEKPPMKLAVSEQECIESPVGHCLYDINNDPHLINCIFCHKPYVRD